MRELIIIGSGPAGLTAAIYAARANLKPLVISGLPPGGQLMLTTEVENYPGFPDGIQGPELIDRMRKQAEKFGAEFLDYDVTSVNFLSYPFEVRVKDEVYKAKAVIIATGASAKWLGLKSEQRLIGRGVSSCAVCLPPQETIIANSSLKTIELITSQDRVLTIDGSFQKVIKRVEREYDGNLIEIKTRFFTEPVYLTEDHPVLKLNLTKSGGANYWNFKFSDLKWVEAKYLQKNDILLYPIIKEIRDKEFVFISDILEDVEVDSSGSAKNKYETFSAKRIPNKININKNFMRLTGYYLSEGYTTNRGINISFHKNEINYIEDVKNLFRIIFGIIPTTKVTGSTCTIMSFSKILRDLFEKLFKKYAHNKKLPEWMMFLPPRKQAEIIKSVWRGGGCKRDKDFCIVTSSRELAYQIRDILLRLNVIASIRARKLEKLKPTLIDGRNVSFKHGMYYVIVGGPSLKRMSEVLGIYHERIKQRKHTCKHAFIRNGFVLLPIRKIERHSYKGKVYNLIVDKNNTYVAKNFVVHNCDAPFFKDKDVVVVGGGDTAINDALFITKYAKKVTVVHRRNKLRASKILQERAFKNEKINFKWNSVVEDIIGDNKVEGIIIKDVKTGEKSKIECQGVFIAIGHKPNTDLFKGQIEIDDYGYIITKNYTETSVKGVFAAGDVCDYRYKQAVTAAGMGCQAAMDAEKYLESMR